MAKQYLMPYTNLHELNLDWLINAMKQLEASWEGAGMNVTATASVTSGTPTVKVSGSLKDTLNFDFELPEGNSFPSDTTPKADNGTGLVGVETTFARGDHVHPSDTTKLDKVTYSDETALYAVMNDKQITLPYSGFATDTDIANLQTSIEAKQDKLISGTSLRTINDNTLLSDGNIKTCQLFKLWENSTPDANFAAQDITISNNFSTYLILYYLGTGVYAYASFIIIPGYDNVCYISYLGKNYARVAQKITNAMHFSNASSGSTTGLENIMIPYIIYGLE